MIKTLYRFLSKKHQNVFLDYKVDFKPRYGHGLEANPYLLEIINRERDTYQNILKKALKYKTQFNTILETTDDSKLPTWNNGFLPGLDLVMIYTILAEFKPRKYIEVGSGNSTKVAYKAKTEQNLEMKITSIDPMPRAEIDDLADEIVRQPFENLTYDFIDSLEKNDILFIDNSHRILPNSDSMVFFLEILPRLKKGVIVHIHDIYLPYDYPQFMCDRAYSEQYGLAIALLANPEKYKTLSPNYFISEDKALSESISEIWQQSNTKNVEKHGGSYWFIIQ